MKIWNILLIQLFTSYLFAISLSAATVDGIRIHSTTNGKGPRTIILVHGWTCDESSWKSQVPDLAKDYRVFTVDLPGHGRSGSPKDGKLSMDLFARAIEAVRSEAKVDRIVLAGHSMGTPVIVQYALLYPKHTIALIFVDGSPVMRPMPKGAPSFARRFAGPDGLKAREAMIRSMFSAATTPEMQKDILSMMLAAPEATAVGAMESFQDDAIWKEGSIMQPVLGVYAGSSQTKEQDFPKIRFLNFEFVKISGTGHFLMLEKPMEFNRLLKSFLDKQQF
jgi:pimeloyl-ACP methyl ester carboxylesterase